LLGSEWGERVRESEQILSELLVLRCRRGDSSAWRELIRLWERRLFYYVRRLVGGERDAWDVLQQTWLAAYRAIPTLREPRALRAWLYRIAHRQAVSHLRHVGAMPDSGAGAIDDAGDVPDDAEAPSFAADAADRVHAALSALSLAHREVLTLHFLEDASVREIADVLEVPEGTVKSRLFHAKRALRAALERGDAS
jgi:RNA polymerase sigma-70 factor (ECF subfamily)